LVLRECPKLREKGFEIVDYSSRYPAKQRDVRLRQARNKGKQLLVIASNSLVGGKRYDNPLFPTGKESGLNWDLVVVDEAHSRAKNPKTELGDALRSKASKFTLNSFVLLLTATPIENNLQVREITERFCCYYLCQYCISHHILPKLVLLC